METEIGKVRLYAMRLVFFLTIIGLAPTTWPKVFSFSGTMDPINAVAISFWAAISMLSIIGFLYPLKMLPLLFLQLLYKALWLFCVGIPLWLQGDMDSGVKELFIANSVGVILDALVIPWLYVFRKYFYKPVW